MKYIGIGILTIGLLTLGFAIPAYAEDKDDRIQRLENQIENVLGIVQELRSEIQILKVQKTEEEEWEDFEEEESEEARAESNLVITGYMDAKFKKRETDDSTFQVGHFNPIFLYRFGDRLLAEGEIEIELERDAGESGSTSLKLEIANIQYLLNDHFTLVAGKFFLPVGVFMERLHPTWINKLPTKPLPYDARLLPGADVGVQVRGAAHVGDAVVRYAGFVTNGPYQVDGSIVLNGNYDDNNGNKALGGRAAIFYPFGDNSVEFGVSGISANWDDGSRLGYSALVFDAELHALEQLLEIRGEAIFTRQETGSHIDREGYYAQIAYKLARIDLPVISNSELVFRYGLVNSDASAADQEQFSFGWNYYFTNTFLAKVAYDINEGDTKAADADLFTVQLAYGF